MGHTRRRDATGAERNVNSSKKLGMCRSGRLLVEQSLANGGLRGTPWDTVRGVVYRYEFQRGFQTMGLCLSCLGVLDVCVAAVFGRSFYLAGSIVLCLTRQSGESK